MTPDAAAMIGLATLTDVGPRRLGLLTLHQFAMFFKIFRSD